jgi:ribosome biogenesis protein SSF1/2
VQRRKTRTHNIRGDVAAAKAGVPKSFVVKAGEVGGSVQNLVRDVRKVLEPNTASRLKVCLLCSSLSIV